jgi:hypothetical protein
MNNVEKLIEEAIHWLNSDHPSSARFLWEHQQRCKELLESGAISPDDYMNIINSVGGHASKSGNLTKLVEVLSE